MARPKPPTAKTASGFEYPVHRLSERLERAREEKLASYRELGSRIRGWLQEYGSEPRRRLSLKPDEARLVHDALAEIQRQSELGQVKPFDDLELALHRLYLTEGPRAVARAMGWSTGKRGKSYPREMTVSDYVWLIGDEPLHGFRTLSGPMRADGKPWYPKRPLPPPEAVKVVAARYGFPSALACREVLRRARTELKKQLREKGEAFGSLVADFVIPDPSQLPRP